MDYPKSNNYVKDDALDELKVKIGLALEDDWLADDTSPENSFLNYMTTDEKPYEDAENMMIRRLNKKVNYFKHRTYSYRKYIRLLHKIINFRDREIRELKRNQIVVNVKSIIKTRKYGHVSTTSRFLRQLKSRTENEK